MFYTTIRIPPSTIGASFLIEPSVKARASITDLYRICLVLSETVYNCSGR